VVDLAGSVAVYELALLASGSKQLNR